MIKIKVCGMRDAPNVLQISELMPYYIGFIFYPDSPRYAGNAPDPELFSSVPSDIVKAGVFVDESKDRILDLASIHGLGLIQLHGKESPEYCSRVRLSGLPVVKSFNIHEHFDFEVLKSYTKVCDYFLFDTKSNVPGGSGKKFNWEKLSDYNLDKPFFLSGGIGPEDADLIGKYKVRGLFAVDINSRFELSPGIKDVEMVKKFIGQIKNVSI